MSVGGCAKVLDAFANWCDLLTLKVNGGSIRGWGGKLLQFWFVLWLRNIMVFLRFERDLSSFTPLKPILLLSFLTNAQANLISRNLARTFKRKFSSKPFKPPAQNFQPFLQPFKSTPIYLRRQTEIIHSKNDFQLSTSDVIKSWHPWR
jgi:hypothetical protein